MAEPAANNYVDFDEYIDYHLAKTRSHIRSTEVFTALGWVGSLFLAYLLLFSVFDQWVLADGVGELARVLMLVGVIAAILALLTWRVARPLLKTVNALYAAKAIEQADPELKSSVLNFVDLRESGTPGSSSVRRAVERRAAVQLEHVDVDLAVDRRPLLRVSYLLLAIMVIAAVYTILSPKDVFTSVKRALLPTAAVAVATQTTISDVSPGDDSLPAHSLLTVEATIRGRAGDRAHLYYTTSDRKFVDQLIEMRRVEEGQPRFRGVIAGENGRGVLQDLSYRVEADDAHTREFAIRVIQPPSARVTDISYTFPSYMQLDPKTQPGGHIDGWEGAVVALAATTNMPVKSARIVLTDSEGAHAKGEEIHLDIVDGTHLAARWKLAMRTDGTYARFYRIECTTARGEIDPDPTQYSILIRPDQPPEVALLAPTSSNLQIPVNGTIPLVIQATDPDFSLRFLTLKAEKDGEMFVDQRLFEDQALGQSFRGSHDFELAPFKLQTGDHFEFWIEAKDNKQPAANRKNTTKIDVTITPPITPQEAREQLAEEKQKQQEQLAQADTAVNAEKAEPPSAPETANPPTTDGQKPQDEPADKVAPPSPRPNDSPPGPPEPADRPQEGQAGQPQKFQNNGDDDASVLEKLLRKQEQERQQQDQANPAPQPDDKSNASGQSGGEKSDAAGSSAKKSSSGGEKQSAAPKGAGRSPSSPPPASNSGPQSAPAPQPAQPNPGQADTKKNANSKPSSSNENAKSPDRPKQGGDQAQPERQPGEKKQPGPNDPSPANPTNEKQPGGGGDSKQKPNDDKTGDGTQPPSGQAPTKPGDSKSTGSKETNPPGTNPPGSGDKPQPQDAGKNQQSDPSKDVANPPGGEKSKADKSAAGDKPDSPKDAAGGEGSKDNTGGGSKKDDTPGGAGGQPPPPGGGQNDPGKKGMSAPPADAPVDSQPGAAGREKTAPPPGSEKQPGGKTNDSGDKGEASAADDGPDAIEKKATGDEKGPAQAADKPTPNATRAKNVLEKKPGSKTTLQPDHKPGDPSDVPSQPDSSKPKDGAGQSASGKAQPADRNAENARPAPERKTDPDKPPHDGEATAFRPTDNPEKKPEKRGGQADNHDDIMQGKGRKDGQRSQKPQGGEAGGSKESREGSQGGNTDGPGDQDHKPGDAAPAGERNGGQSGDQKGPGSKSQPSEQGKASKSGATGQPSKSADAQPRGEGSSPAGSGGDKKSGSAPQSGEGSPGVPSDAANPVEGQKSGGGIGSQPAPEGNRHGGGQTGPDAGAAPAGGSETNDVPEAAKLEYARKATNLVLKRLKNELDRGEVDAELLKELGWTKADVQRFVERMDRQLHESDDDSLEAAARRLQFEETLKSLELGGETKNRAGDKLRERRTKQIDARRVPVPAEYRDGYDAYTRGLSKQKK